LSAPCPRRSGLLPLLLGLAACLPAPVQAGTAGTESWLGLYFNGSKMGWSRIRVLPATFRGKPALKTLLTSVTRMELLGNKVSQDISATLYSDRSLAPLHQTYVMKSNGSTLALTAEYRPGRIVCVLKSGTGTSTKVVPVPKGVKLVGDSNNVIAGKPIAVGLKDTFHYLNPLTLALDRTDVTVQAQETVALGGTTYTAFRLTSTTPLGTLVSWQTSTGEMLKGDMPLGLSMIKEDRAAALNLKSAMPAFAVSGSAPSAAVYVPPSDFAVSTAIAANRPIESPRTARALALTISGLDNPERVISDSRQQAAPVAGQEHTYTFRVTARRFDPARSAELPVTDPALQPLLRRAPLLEIDNPRVLSLARRLRGGEKNAYKAARKIHEWVHKNMTGDYSIGVPRSCTDVLERPRGVCRDYATLAAGLCRAAGIPSRVVGGIVYAEGKFFYHAWTECWVGEWVPFDATQPGSFVDATHVKFAQGDVTDMYNVASIVGRIKVNVESVE